MPLSVGWEKASDAGIPKGKPEGINPILTGRAINRLPMPEILQTRHVGRTLDTAINKLRETRLPMLLRRTPNLNSCTVAGGWKKPGWRCQGGKL